MAPHITNQIIREALRPYPEHLAIVTKVGAKRGSLGSVHPAMSREDITQAVQTTSEISALRCLMC
jgi:pyridoxine 4-dehydrogenase